MDRQSATRSVSPRQLPGNHSTTPWTHTIQSRSVSMALLESHCPDLRLIARGKVRDIYEFPGDDSKLLFVATDRISAFDIVMKNGIPNKGKLLTQLSLFFFDKLESVIPNHVISGDFEHILSLSNAILPYREQLEGRTILVQKSQVLKCEAIVRGYLTGSAYAEYRKSGTVHGIPMPQNLVESSKFPQPIFTPSTKADIGTHDENIHPDKLGGILGSETLADQIKKTSIELYEAANRHCLSSNSGLFLADTKFEFGLEPNSQRLLLIDECLTPDSSRFWAASEWAEGKKMSGFDKQVLRDWLKIEGVDGKDQLELPQSVIDSTWKKYCEAFELLTGRKFVA
ncbi:hypothetical protein PtB15_2B853 [Puccinia triticina]|nr:hypothetical protein PtB15_2B853 [Puccinia triticina]